MDQVVDRDVKGVVVSQHDHGHRVADEDEVDLGLVGDPGRRRVVSGHHDQRLVGILASPHRWRGLLGRHHESSFSVQRPTAAGGAADVSRLPAPVALDIGRLQAGPGEPVRVPARSRPVIRQNIGGNGSRPWWRSGSGGGSGRSAAGFGVGATGRRPRLGPAGAAGRRVGALAWAGVARVTGPRRVGRPGRSVPLRAMGPCCAAVRPVAGASGRHAGLSRRRWWAAAAVAVGRMPRR